MLQVDDNKHTLAKYLMELTIVEYDMVQYLPSKIAAGALCLSMKLLDNSNWVSTQSLLLYSVGTTVKINQFMRELARHDC